MAEHIGTVRRAARHTGREYGKGYPYRVDEEFTVNFGPFRGYSLAPGIGNELDYLQAMTKTVVRASGATAPLALIAAKNHGVEILGQFQMRVNGVMYHVLFQEKASEAGKIEVIITETDDTQTTHQSSQNHGSKRIDAEPWGVRIYYINEHITSGVFFLDLSGTPAFASVSGSPTGGGKFLFILENNMVFIGQDSTTKLWSAQWAVDSDPTDWTGAGSGSNTFSSYLGDPVGYGRMGQRMVVVFEHGGVSLVPTGTLPVFQFIEEPGISGGIGEVGSDKTNIYYVDRTQRVVQFNGNQEIFMGHGWEVWTSTAAVYFSQACRCLIVTDIANADSDQTLFYDIQTREIIGRADGEAAQVYITDRPFGSGRSQLYIQRADTGAGQQFTFPTRVAGFNDVTGDGTFNTEWITFPQLVTIVKVRLIMGQNRSTAGADITCGIEWYPGTLAIPATAGATGLLDATNKTSQEPGLEYDFNQAVDQFRVLVAWPQFIRSTDEIRKIIVYCRVTTDDDVEVMG